MHAGIQRIGHEHGVVEGDEVKPVLGEDQQIELDVLPDLQNGTVHEERLQGGDRIFQRNLFGCIGIVEIETTALRAVLERYVAGLARRDAERKADEACLHGIETVGLAIDGDDARVARTRHPTFKLGKLRHRNIFGFFHRRVEIITDGAEYAASACGFLLCLFRGRFFLFLGNRKFGGRLDRFGVDARSRRHALRQRVELHRAQEGDEAFGIGRMDAEVFNADLHRHLVVERDELFRYARLFGKVDEIFAALGLLDFAGARKKGFEVTIFLDQLRRCLDADAGDAGHIVNTVACKRLDLDNLLGRHAEFLDDLIVFDRLHLHSVEHVDIIVDELHQILVRRNDGDASARLARLTGIGGDEVVGLKSHHLDGRHRESANRIAHQGELGTQVFRWLGALGLIFGIDVVAEGLGRGIEDDGEMGRLELVLRVLDKLVEHVAKARDGPDGRTVGFARQRRQRMIGAENIARSIDQKEVIALFERAGRDAAAHIFFRFTLRQAARPSYIDCSGAV